MRYSRTLYLSLGFALFLLGLLVYQKCSAREDRYIGEGYDCTIDFIDGEYTVLFFGFSKRMTPEEMAASLQGNTFTVEYYGSFSRDWSYLPPYFRWFYGGK